MTKEEAINYLKQEGELKIYKFINGYLLMENESNMGYNYVIPAEEQFHDDIDKDVLIPKIGDWIIGHFSYIDENEAKDFKGRLFGYRLKIEVEPIFTDDYLLSTNLENR